MQLNTNDKQLYFREYKFILDGNQLAGTDQDRDKVMSILESQIDNQNITLKKPEEKQFKQNVQMLKQW
jgi:hypothetical protein